MASTEKPSSSHLSFLDGLRGLAALFVVAHHAFAEVAFVNVYGPLPALWKSGFDWLRYGQVAVDIFIVLSGYCLMLPVARASGQLRGGFAQYLFRRAKRILPPYFIALIAFLLVIAFVPGMNQKQGLRWDVALPAFEPKVLISHLLLIHNLNGDWLHRIDPPMWSVATEWQIYFLFPLILLPIWRRFGNLAAVIAGFVIGLVPYLVFHRGDGACPWFIGLFALGMGAATLNSGPKETSQQRIIWSARATIGLTVLYFLGTFTIDDWLWNHIYAMDSLIGLITAAFLVFCAEHCRLQSPNKPFLLRIMELPFAVTLGKFSYSLYLVHFPILSMTHLYLRSLALSGTTILLLLLTVGVMISLAVSYGFHLLFERPFMSNPATKTAVTAERKEQVTA